MFDLHMHSRVSFDSVADPRQMLGAARAAGLREICFTDHLDYDPKGVMTDLAFSFAEYRRELDGLSDPCVTVRRGFEFGMLADNAPTLARAAKSLDPDLIIGSVHFARGEDVYYPAYWQERTVEEAERDYLCDVLACVQAHDDFDVLGHITYLSKAEAHTGRRPIPLEVHRGVIDEIFCTLIQKGKGLELNTSGMDACGAFLPTADYFVRFRQLGGRIVTVGSDAHTPGQVGRHTHRAVRLLGELFGYVCSFAGREPVFHPL